MVVHPYVCIAGAAGEVIGQLGGVQDILEALKTHASSSKLCSVGLNALWGLSVHGITPVLPPGLLAQKYPYSGMSKSGIPISLTLQIRGTPVPTFQNQRHRCA
ncbi:hypothetical protein DPMN_154744 [Dreissena polymorpha]|uniref:Uncharacterized protein n=1 Tax=Dreissena polymorpha TaxID=45954 RepID=A0A9D4FL26_DREPO|nr:hypothetical protein DPMN_154744 [Dreissena polymorpha]